MRRPAAALEAAPSKPVAVQKRSARPLFLYGQGRLAGYALGREPAATPLSLAGLKERRAAS